MISYSIVTRLILHLNGACTLLRAMRGLYLVPLCLVPGTLLCSSVLTNFPPVSQMPVPAQHWLPLQSSGVLYLCNAPSGAHRASRRDVTAGREGTHLAGSVPCGACPVLRWRPPS